MKKKLILFAFPLLMMANVSCQKEELSVCEEACLVTNPIASKEQVKAALVGDWKWIKTVFPQRGSETTAFTDTPQLTGKETLYRFTEDRFLILEDGRIVQDQPYRIQFWGEGTNTVDPILLLQSYSPTTGYSFGSILRVDQGLSCLNLINSYDGAGRDLSLKKIAGPK